MASRVVKITSISVGDFYDRHKEARGLKLGGAEDGFERASREQTPL